MHGRFEMGVVLLAFFVSGCVSEAPEGVKTAAIRDLPRARAQVLYDPIRQYRNLHVTCAAKNPLTADDQRHGITEVWCCMVEGSVFEAPRGHDEWVPLRQDMIVMGLPGGIWGATVTHGDDCACN